MRVEGTLFDNGSSGLGLMLDSGAMISVVWPYGYTAFASIGGAQLVGPSGDLIAGTGDWIRIDGIGPDRHGERIACGKVTRVPFELRPTLAATIHPTAAPSLRTTGMTERERSDWFWEAVSTFAPTAFTYESLADITADAHLVVRGRVTGVQTGQLQPFESGGVSGRRTVIFGVVTIDDVLKGVPQSVTPGTILVARTGLESLAVDDLPAGEVILFLKNYAQMRIDGGYPPSIDPEDRLFYGRPNGYQCVLRDLDGVLRIVDGPKGWAEALGPFPSGLDGDPFEVVLDRIRTLVEEAL